MDKPTITVGHEKLGQITFQGEAENSIDYNNKTIKEIFFKGIETLISEKILAPEDKSVLENFIQKMQMGIDESQTVRSLIKYQVNNATGQVDNPSYYIYGNTANDPVVDMIQTMLDDLCQIIVLAKHPGEDLHGDSWVEYAEVLLPPEYIDYTLKTNFS